MPQGGEGWGWGDNRSFLKSLNTTCLLISLQWKAKPSQPTTAIVAVVIHSKTIQGPPSEQLSGCEGSRDGDHSDRSQWVGQEVVGGSSGDRPLCTGAQPEEGKTSGD